MRKSKFSQPQKKLQAFFEGQNEEQKNLVHNVEITVPEVFLPFFGVAPYKVAYGGRGSGKSWFFATYIITQAMESEKRIVCTRMYQTSIAQSVHKLLCDVIKRLGLREDFRITDTYITCRSTGSTIVFKGLAINPDEIKSFEGADICWVEEAQNVSREIWRILLPTIRKEGAEVLISFNPDMHDDATYQDFVINPKPNSIVIKANYDANPYFTKRLRDEMEHCKSIDFAEYENIWLGEPRTFSEAQVFKGRYEVKDFETPEGVKFMFGADWGFARDPSTLIRCYTIGNVLYVDRELYKVGVELDALPDFYNEMEGLQKRDIFADSSRPETIHFMRKRGFRIRPAKKWGGSIMDGIAILKGFEKIIIHSRCVHTAKEFRLYSYQVNKSNGEIFPKLTDAHNHCIDAIRYALDKFIRGRHAMKIRK